MSRARVAVLKVTTGQLSVTKAAADAAGLIEPEPSKRPAPPTITSSPPNHECGQSDAVSCVDSTIWS
jgi:hypothetical protein